MLARLSSVVVGLLALTSSAYASIPAKGDLRKVGEPKIVGGTEVTPAHKYPWMVLLYPSDGQNTYLCGGTLVADDWVLTAAHCSDGIYPDQSIAWLGAHDNTNSNVGVQAKVARIHLHPQYNRDTFEYDYAMWKLADKYDDYEFVNLQTTHDVDSPAEGTSLVIMGWGHTSFGGSASDVLLESTIDVWDWDECTDVYDEDMMNEDIQICAGTAAGGRDTCQGDSGGPILAVDGLELVQVGVVSYGKGCADANVPGVYSRVSGQIDWIQETLNSSSMLAPSMFLFVTALFLQFFRF